MYHNISTGYAQPPNSTFNNVSTSTQYVDDCEECKAAMQQSNSHNQPKEPQAAYTHHQPQLPKPQQPQAAYDHHLAQIPQVAIQAAYTHHPAQPPAPINRPLHALNPPQPAQVPAQQFQQSQLQDFFYRVSGIDRAIDIQEFIRVVLLFNQNLRNHPQFYDIVHRLFSQMDTNRNGYISLNEFMSGFPTLKQQLGI
jgi:hypothetical protein